MFSTPAQVNVFLPENSPNAQHLLSYSIHSSDFIFVVTCFRERWRRSGMRRFSWTLFRQGLCNQDLMRSHCCHMLASRRQPRRSQHCSYRTCRRVSEWPCASSCSLESHISSSLYIYMHPSGRSEIPLLNRYFNQMLQGPHIHIRVTGSDTATEW